MPISAIETYTGAKLEPAVAPELAVTVSVRFPRSTSLAKGTVLGFFSTAAASEVQSLAITGTPTGGTFTLTFDGQTTSAIAYNASAATVQTALEALSTIGTGNVLCAGGALPGTAISITFRNALAYMNVPAITTTDSLTGGTSPASAITTSTAGSGGPNVYAAYSDGASDGTQVARAILVHTIRTDGFGRVIYGDQTTSEHGGTDSTAPVYIGGYFNTADLTGLDAAAVTDLGVLVKGTTSSGILKF